MRPAKPRGSDGRCAVLLVTLALAGCDDRIGPDDPLMMRTAAGNFQEDTVGGTLTVDPAVYVSRGRAPAAGVRVTWTVPADGGEGTVSSRSGFTDEAGVGRVSWTLGRWPGEQKLKASIMGGAASEVTFLARAWPGSPVRLQLEGDRQVGLPGDTLGQLRVWPLDRYDNPVPGTYAISWAAEPDVERVEGSAFTAPEGFATARFVLGSGYGARSITASLPELPDVPPAVFSATAVHAIVELVGGQLVGGAFSPDSIAIPTGGLVGWIWRGSCDDEYWCSYPIHDVSFEDDPAEPTSSPSLREGTHVRAFTAPGSFRYRCTHHSQTFRSGMVGMVTVGEP